MQSLISAKLLCECRQRGSESIELLECSVYSLFYKHWVAPWKPRPLFWLFAAYASCAIKRRTQGCWVLVIVIDRRWPYSANVFLYRNRVFFEHKCISWVAEHTCRLLDPRVFGKKLSGRQDQRVSIVARCNADGWRCLQYWLAIPPYSFISH